MPFAATRRVHPPATRWAAWVLALLLSPLVQAQDDPRRAMEALLPDCLPRYAEIDARIAKAGVGDASYYRVPGYPYLRSDRLLASYDAELDDPGTFDTWMLQLRDNDGFSRDIELRNLGLSDPERALLLSDLRLCAVWLSFLEFSEPEKVAELKKRIHLPEPAAPAAHTVVGADAAPDTDATVPVQRPLRPARTQDATGVLARYRKLPRDELNRTGMTQDGWTALAEHHAPIWLLARGAPGALTWSETGLVVDAQRPTVYFQPSFARMGDTALVQFHYVLWFARPAGGVDGLIWRVTLDEQGRPLMHESLDAAGQRHRWYPAQRLEPMPDVPVAVEAPMGIGPLAVSLEPSDHDVRAVQAAEAGEGPTYQLVPYESLLTLPLPGGETRSAFDTDGRLRASGAGPASRPLWQLGHLRLRHAEQARARAFDDPRLLETYFRRPAAPEIARR